MPRQADVYPPHAALAHLGAGASIIATGSIAAFFPGSIDFSGPGGLGYGFSKRVIATYINDLALCVGRFNIRVNAVHPTNVDTPMLQNAPVYAQFRPDLQNPSRDDAEAGFAELNLMPITYVDPVDVSNAIVYLASDESRYVTGMQIRIDAGGYLKVHPFHI
jgi:NAD(P)-dependent dehydrogenase (short-subunit alcohol dehydrogenase family)